MKNILITSTLLVALCLVGCGGSLPECGDKEVINLLKEISKKQGIELVSVSGISTKKREGNECRCTALGKFKFMGDVEEANINYIINLADNKEEFTVTMRLGE